MVKNELIDLRGAEAVLKKISMIGKSCLIKSRIPKPYRVAELDIKLRSERTRSEARLLHKAKLAGVHCPIVYELGEFEITMSILPGERPNVDAKIGAAKSVGALLAKLHAADIIHGDFTPANLIGDLRSPSKLSVIDFGLGFVSNDVEDKAVDVFTMLRSIHNKENRNAFLAGYGDYKNSTAVLARLKEVEKRVRYAF